LDHPEKLNNEPRRIYINQERILSFEIWAIVPGANPTIASYNARVVNFYNAAGSLARFEN
jgi:hypothetical protein